MMMMMIIIISVALDIYQTDKQPSCCGQKFLLCVKYMTPHFNCNSELLLRVSVSGKRYFEFN